MTNLNNKFYTIFFALSLQLLCVAGFGQNKNDYLRFVDSADAYIDESTAKAISFLDSIPNPIEDYIEGGIGDYYAIKALIHDDKSETAEVFQSFILSHKYAVKEGNFRTAGEACVELFSTLYFVKRDSTAYKYLDKAKDYYSRCNYNSGLIEVEQMYIYAIFLDGKYEACNDLILQNLDSYKAVKNDSYYEMFAIYMLTSNYIYLENFEKAHFYFNDFKKFDNDTSIAEYNYFSFKATIELCFADVYLQKKELDQAHYYLSKSSKLLNYMGEDCIEDLYSLYANYYKHSGQLAKSKSYLDSLRVFQDKIYKNIINASCVLNDKLLKAENEIVKAGEKDFFEKFWMLLLLIFMVCVICFYVIINRQSKKEINQFQKKNEEYSYLKVNHEKLKLRVHSLEEYITDVKKEVKSISSINDVSEQRNKIKELYKDVRFNCSTVLSKEESHLELITDLNVDFFTKISSNFPLLKDSEIIICYYLFTGFKSKEIAVFLNTSIRAIESKRYRIRKKMNVQPPKLSLYEFICRSIDVKEV